MIFIFILSFASLEEFLEAITGLFSVLFSRELSQLRKVEGDVDESREHSFMFLQATHFMDACLLHVAVYFRTGIIMPYTRVGLFFLKIGLIKEEKVGGVRLFCYDGWRVAETNDIFMAHHGTWRCRCARRRRPHSSRWTAPSHASVARTTSLPLVVSAQARSRSSSSSCGTSCSARTSSGRASGAILFMARVRRRREERFTFNFNFNVIFAILSPADVTYLSVAQATT